MRETQEDIRERKEREKKDKRETEIK